MWATILSNTEDQIDLYHLVTALSFKGLASGGLPSGKAFAENLDYIRTAHADEEIVITAIHEEDVAQIDAVLKDMPEQHNNVAVLWLLNKEKPAADNVPVIVYQQVDKHKGILNWEELCALSTLEYVPPVPLTKKISNFIGQFYKGPKY